ncbi:MAG: hypothetical protein IKA80_05470 [Spirochaetaceae bacterium]|nr:hypothetical protein [Spirochaetaceae bacterium]
MQRQDLGVSSSATGLPHFLPLPLCVELPVLGGLLPRCPPLGFPVVDGILPPSP